MARVDDDIVRQVNADADLPAIAGRFTRLHKHGKKYEGLCPFHTEKTPSFGLFKRKSGGGWGWRCLGSCNEGGDAISFVMKAERVEFPEALRLLGAPAVITDDDRRRVDDMERRYAEDARKDLAFKIDAARDLWRAGQPLAGTVAEHYLEMCRAIPGPFPASLRFLPAHKHKDDGREFPTLIGIMSDRDRNFTGVHRTYLRADGWAKAEVKKGAAKKMLGQLEGSLIWFDPPGEDVLLGEGNESALSVRAAKRLPTAACMSLYNFNAPLPGCVRRVTLCFDSDEKHPEEAEEVKQAAIRAHQERGLIVRVARAPLGMDFNDVLKGKGRGL